MRMGLRVMGQIGLLVLGLSLAGTSAFALTLVQDGRASSRIFIRADAPKPVQEAADELARVLNQMSGAELPVAKAASAAEVDKNAPAVVLGALAEELGLKMEKASAARDGFRFKAVGKHLLIVGESPRGVYNGVFGFLETLGCGWFTPGAVGEVIPRKPTVAVPDDLDRSEASDSIHRSFWGGGDWARRNKAQATAGTWRHAWGFLVPRELFKQQPELFSLNGGKRTPRQLCTTNPETIRVAADALLKLMDKEPPERLVFEAGPNDGGGLCQCPQCVQLDTPGYLEPSSGLPACTDRVLKFVTDLAEITSRRYPNKYLGFYVYSEYSRVPLKVTRINPNVFPMFAPIRRCRFHGPGEPGCPWNQLWLQEIQAFGKMTDKLGFYIYNYNLADTLLPVMKITCYKRLVQAVRGLHVRLLAWEFETITNWAMYAPHFYLSARICWNSQLDVDAEMDRFFSGFYAEAVEPMRRYWLRIDRATATAPTHTGSQYGLHHIWTDALLAESRKDIEEAKALARDERVREAVAMADAGLTCAELFIRIRKGIVGFDFLGAEKAQAELKDHVDLMAKHTEPTWVLKRYAYDQYYQRFIGRTVDGGAKVLRDGGQILVKLPDVWKFKKDERAVGAQEGWAKPDLGDADWQDFATVSKSWDDQGLGWYHGDGWYRVHFTLPAAEEAPKGRAEARTANQDLRLWFGGFDYNVDVYLNGVSLGEKRGFATPAEFGGIAPHLKFGGENVLAVRVSAGDLAELGTGGIMMPVMIYRTGK